MFSPTVRSVVLSLFFASLTFDQLVLAAQTNPADPLQYSLGNVRRAIVNNAADFGSDITEVSEKWVLESSEAGLPSSGPPLSEPQSDSHVSDEISAKINTKMTGVVANHGLSDSIPEVSPDWTVESSSRYKTDVNGGTTDIESGIFESVAGKPTHSSESVSNAKLDEDDLIEVSRDWEVTVISRTGDSTTAAVSTGLAAASSIVDSKSEPTPQLKEVAHLVKPDEPDAAQVIDLPVTNDNQVLPHKVILNGQKSALLRAYESQSGHLLLPLEQIAQQLGDSILIDNQSNKVKYIRSRDGARFELDTQTGEVLANNRSVGFLNEVSLLDLQYGLFPANAVQVFSGLHIERDDTEPAIHMRLDKRLQYITGFELYVNGQLLPYVNPEPRSLGHVLLLPLEVIVDELGGRMLLSADGNEVSVTRYQDNARISLNLLTGLVEVEDKPVGSVANISYADRQLLLLPKEAVASLTGTYVTVLPGSRRIDVDLDDELARIIHPGESILSRAASSPPSVESVETFFDSENRASAVVRGHYSEYNLRLEYETPTTLGEDGFTPEWLQLFAESIEGWGLGVGDHYTQKRELSGVSTSRLKGAYFYNPLKDGLLVATAGTPVSGSRELDRGDRVPEFDGEAGGLRYYANEGDFEAGLAFRNDENSEYRAVVAQHLQNIG